VKFSSLLAEKTPDDSRHNLIPLLIELANSQECRNLRRALAFVVPANFPRRKPYRSTKISAPAR
jgi:hypothetical protein